MTNEEKVATATPSNGKVTYDKPFELGDNKIMIFKKMPNSLTIGARL